MILPGMGQSETAKVADAVRDGCHNKKIKVPTGEEVSFSTSIGIAVLGDKTEDRIRFLQRADDALYCKPAEPSRELDSHCHRGRVRSRLFTRASQKEER